MVNSPSILCVNFRIGSKENLIENYKQLQELESDVTKTIFALKRLYNLGGSSNQLQ